jgi:CRP/FNR family transcriptional regulator, cyclic AMP receptor protein
MTMNAESLQDLLRSVSIFENVSDEALRNLGRAIRVRDYPTESLIFSQDDSGNALFIIVSGRVKVSIVGASGREAVLCFLHAEDFFGEMALLDGMPRSANVMTTEPSRLAILEREAFLRCIQKRPEIAINVLTELSKRLRKADEIISNLALLDVYGRVARALIDLAEQDGMRTPGGIVIARMPSQKDLASLVCTSRETVSRVINEFKQRGLLSTQGKKLVLSHQFYQDRDEHA